MKIYERLIVAPISFILGIILTALGFSGVECSWGYGMDMKSVFLEGIFFTLGILCIVVGAIGLMLMAAGIYGLFGPQQ